MNRSGFYLAALGFASLGIGRATTVVCFLDFVVWLCHRIAISA